MIMPHSSVSAMLPRLCCCRNICMLRGKCNVSVLTMKQNHYTFSSQLRADQMPGPPQEGQLMCTLFLSMRQ